jgi:hypothetical protein
MNQVIARSHLACGTQSTALTNGDVLIVGGASLLAQPLPQQKENRFQPQADIWVKLRDRPHPYSDDEALLLCEADIGEWIAWISGFGQMTLQPGEFYRLD